MTNSLVPQAFIDYAKTQCEKIVLFNEAQRSTPSSVCFPWMIILDVQSFESTDIRIKDGGKFVIVKGHHREKLDEFGWVERYFTRKCILPEGNRINSIRAAYITRTTLLIAVFLETSLCRCDIIPQPRVNIKNIITKGGYIEPFALYDYFLESPFLVDDDFGADTNELKELAELMERVMVISDLGIKRDIDGKPIQMNSNYLDTVKDVQNMVHEIFDNYEINHEPIEVSINAALERVESQLALYKRNHEKPAETGIENENKENEQTEAEQNYLLEDRSNMENLTQIQKETISEEDEMPLDEEKQLEDILAFMRTPERI